MATTAHAPIIARELVEFLGSHEVGALQRDLATANCYLALKAVPDSLSWMVFSPHGIEVLEFQKHYQYDFPASPQYLSRYSGVRDATSAELQSVTCEDIAKWREMVMGMQDVTTVQVDQLPITADYEPSISEGSLVRPPKRFGAIARWIEDQSPTNFPAIEISLPRRRSAS